MQVNVFLPEQITHSKKFSQALTASKCYPPFLSENCEVQEVKVQIGAKLHSIYELQADERKVVVTNVRSYSPAKGESVLFTRSGLVPKTEKEAKKDGALWLNRPSDDLTLIPPDVIAGSWRDKFVFKEEADGKPGLRTPQAGALYATLAYWKLAHQIRQPGLVVMPTGTGKTETMLSLLVQQRIKKLLVLVPSVALRKQLSDKFRTLGVLRQFGIVLPEATTPTVTVVSGKPQTDREVKDAFSCANVIVANVQALTGLNAEVMRAIRDECTHLFVDEAHHIPAQTWTTIKNLFEGKPSIFFTATPFRQDGKPIEATPVFNYSLKQAQDEDYFKKIHFEPVEDYDEDSSDDSIADRAVSVLKSDLDLGLDHRLMARTDSIPRAHQLHSMYTSKYPEFNPVLITSEDGKRAKEKAVDDLRSGASKIIVCVDMLGEGFDLPQMKVAAIHKVHKSLAVTLQFVGRFTRNQPGLGDATVVANLADARVRKDLQDLYSEGADWSFLLQEKSAGTANSRLELNKFVRGFDKEPKFLSLYTIAPRLSTVVYKTKVSAWTPLELVSCFSKESILDGPFYNDTEEVALIATRALEPVEWSSARSLKETHWHLHLLHWDAKRQLLYIHTTVPRTFSIGVARAVAGNDVELVKGEEAFRIFAKVDQLILTNLGLKATIGRALSFEMLAGSNVRQALATARQENKLKSNLFGLGYLYGHPMNAGCSAKGRFWSLSSCDDVLSWKEWCSQIGDFVSDQSLTVDHIISNAAIWEQLNGRPNAVPIAVDWNRDILVQDEEKVCLEINGGEEVGLHEVSLNLLTFDDTSPIRFEVESAQNKAVYELVFDSQGRPSYQCVSGVAKISVNKKEKRLLDEWFNDGGAPTIYFHDRSLVRDGQYVRLRSDFDPFERNKIEVWPWNVNITKESQGIQRDQDTVQYFSIQKVAAEGYTIVIDDDASGESADIVGFRVNNDGGLDIGFFHCKFSGEEVPGARTSDLYEVCGQAQKSSKWFQDLEELFRHLLRRNQDREKKHGTASSRFQLGDPSLFKQLISSTKGKPMTCCIAIVQPGLSVSKASGSQLKLIAATELFLKETSQIPLRVVGST